MKNKLNEKALGYAAAIVSAIFMLILSILGKFNVYSGATDMMQEMHMFYSLSPLGMISGMIEAAIISFVIIYLFGIFYNNLNK